MKRIKVGGGHTTRIKDPGGEEKNRDLDVLRVWLDVEIERDLN